MPWIPTVGEKIFSLSSLKDPSTYREYTVTKVGEDTVQCGSSENTMYTAFCWPMRVKDEMLAISTEWARLQKIADDQMTLVLELRNALSRGEK